MTKNTAPQIAWDFFFIFNVYRDGNKYRKEEILLKEINQVFKQEKIVSKSCFKLATIPEMRNRVTIMGITEDKHCHKPAESGDRTTTLQQGSHVFTTFLSYKISVWGVISSLSSCEIQKINQRVWWLVPLPNIHGRVSAFGEV